MKESLLRSMFFVPGHVDKYLDKISSLKADAIILDLEDSVPFDQKDNARVRVNSFLKNSADKTKSKFFVRLNETDQGCLLKDIEATMHPRLTGYMPSKIKSVKDILFLDQLLLQFEHEKSLELGSIKLIPLIETLDAFIYVSEIAKASKRLIALAFGGEDYLNELGGKHGIDDHTFDYPRTKIAIAAKSAGLQAIDTPFLDVGNNEGFYMREQKSRDLGFEGCLLIHPSQISQAHKCFSPTEKEIENAKAILEAVEFSAKSGLNVVLKDNVLIGPPMQKKAKKIITKLQLIELNYG